MTTGLKIKEQRRESGKINFCIDKVNKNLKWPPNSMLIYYICEKQNFNLQKAMKSYKILDENDSKIVIIDEIACEIYDSRKKID